MSNKNKKDIKNKFNPYDILSVNKDADQNTITKSYRKLVIKWHPDKFKPTSTDPKEIEKENENAKEMYEKISKANEILSDQEKRNKYDKYGITDQNDEQEMGEQMARDMMMKERLKEVIKVNISITEALNGLSKSLNIQRQVINTTTNMRTLENITIKLEIDSTIPINKPIIFEGKGKKVNNDSGDLFVMLNLTPDATYKLNKSNNNIITLQKISLAQSLCGFEMSIPHNKKNLLIQCDNIIKQDYIYTVKNMGLTIADENEQLHKTNIEVHFDIQYPTKLDENTLKELKQVFKYNYKKTESAINKDIVKLDENKIDSNDENNEIENGGIGLEQIFGMGGIPGMGGFPGMGGMGGIPGMGGFPGMSGMGGIPGMSSRGGRPQQVHVQECNQS